jgi:hypothetical protein
VVVAQRYRQVRLDAFDGVEFQHVGSILAGGFQAFAGFDGVILEDWVSVTAGETRSMYSRQPPSLVAAAPPLLIQRLDKTTGSPELGWVEARSDSSSVTLRRRAKTSSRRW